MTATQQILLGALAAQLRVAAGTILSSGDLDPESAEAALGGLVVRTLALVDEALAGQRALDAPPEQPTLLPTGAASSRALPL